jgi:hypothetical protein
MMEWKNIPRELVRVRKQTSRVGPIICIVVMAPLLLLAHDGVPWHFISIILLCVVQLAWPTLLGWIVLAIPSTVLYTVAVGYLASEWVRYGLDPTEAGALALYLVPLLAVWWSNPLRGFSRFAK